MSGTFSRVDLKGHDHSAFDRRTGRTREILWYLCKVCFFLTSIPFSSSFKTSLLRLFGAKAGKGIVIRPRVNIQMPWKLTMGNHCWIGEEVLILNFDQVTIGSNVCLSQRVFICAGNHDFRDPGMAFRASPIVLHDGVWVGATAFVGPGVSVGVDTVISAGSIILNDLEENAVYRGNPAVFSGRRWE